MSESLTDKESFLSFFSEKGFELLFRYGVH